MRLLLPILACLLAAPAWSAEPVGDAPADHVRELAHGWTFFEAGNLARAEDAFTRAYETTAGRTKAELYYGLSAVWWERRNALAAYDWLVQAKRLATEQPWAFDAGEDGVWLRRAEGRRRWIERNFTVVKLKLPSARALPPLADPPPADPLLRKFTDGIDKAVIDAYEAGARTVWLLLPNGTYFVDGAQRVLGGGEMAAHKAETWELVGDRGSSRKARDERVEALARAEADGTLGDLQTAALVKSAKRQAEPGQRRILPFVRKTVLPEDARVVARAISEHGFINTFAARYSVEAYSGMAEHGFSFPEGGFSVKIAAGTLIVQGLNKLREPLGQDWVVGNDGGSNLVEMRFDGLDLTVTVNGVDHGPVRVRGDAEIPLGSWRITMPLAEIEISHLWIEPWMGE